MNGFNFKKLVPNFKFAFSGIKTIIQEKQPFRIMIISAILVIVAMICFNLTLIHKIIVLFTIVLVLSLELLNSVIEKLLDFICPQVNKKVEKIKDMSAGVVLIASIGAALIGILIFLPYILAILLR